MLADVPDAVKEGCDMGGLVRMFLWGVFAIVVLVPLGAILVLGFGFPIMIVAAVLVVPLLLALLAIVGIPLLLLVAFAVVCAILLAFLKVALFLLLPVIILGMIVSWIFRGFCCRRTPLTTW
jgi:hypothetical protein